MNIIFQQKWSFPNLTIAVARFRYRIDQWQGRLESLNPRDWTVQNIPIYIYIYICIYIYVYYIYGCIRISTYNVYDIIWMSRIVGTSTSPQLFPSPSGGAGQRVAARHPAPREGPCGEWLRILTYFNRRK